MAPAPRSSNLANATWGGGQRAVTVRHPPPPFFRMCGSERIYRGGGLDVWQRKDLQAYFRRALADVADVWQGKDLRR